MKVGIQWDTEVTVRDSEHLVFQVYCSALPVAYINIPFYYWQPFAQLTFNEHNEATFYLALKNYEKTKNPLLYLTLVGGGAFGNETEWNLMAVRRSIQLLRKTPLNVKVVRYGQSNQRIRKSVSSINTTN